VVGKPVSVVLDFPREISAVEDRSFLNLSGPGSSRRVLFSVSELLSGSVHPSTVSLAPLPGPTVEAAQAAPDAEAPTPPWPISEAYHQHANQGAEFRQSLLKVAPGTDDFMFLEMI